MQDNKRMKRVFIASPARGRVAENRVYAQMALLHQISMGMMPIASHLLLPQVLTLGKPEDEEYAIEWCRTWLPTCGTLAIYTDLQISAGMQAEIDLANKLGIYVEMLKLPGDLLQQYKERTRG